MKYYKFFIILIISIIINLNAQSNIVIKGAVRNNNNYPIEKIKIQIKAGTEVLGRTETDTNGNFTLEIKTCSRISISFFNYDYYPGYLFNLSGMFTQVIIKVLFSTSDKLSLNDKIALKQELGAIYQDEILTADNNETKKQTLLKYQQYISALDIPIQTFLGMSDFEYAVAKELAIDTKLKVDTLQKFQALTPYEALIPKTDTNALKILENEIKQK